MSAVEDARALAEAMLAPHLPDRWRHVRGVAAQAQRVANVVSAVDVDILVESAWLHDIGYSPDVVEVEFHPLDGARFLTARGINRAVVELVAHHSCAVVEARLRRIEGLGAYQDQITPTRDALWYCDATTGPRGERLRPSERWAEVRQRYGPRHVVARFLDEAEPAMRAAVGRTEERMRSAGVTQSM